MHTSQKYPHIAAIILVGGYSSRMKTLKALLPLNKKASLLTHSIFLFQKAGIENIFLVLGFEQERIKSHIKEWEKEYNQSKSSCKIVYNPNFDKGMYTSVCAGFQAILQEEKKGKKHAIDASFLFPVDAALLQSKSIEHILKETLHTKERAIFSTCHEKEAPQELIHKIEKNSIYIPSFLDKCGHPPLITKEHFEPILQYEEEFKRNAKGQIFRGLQGYFKEHLPLEFQASFLQGKAPQEEAFFPYKNTSPLRFVPLVDEGILCDIDTPEEYTKSMQFLKLTENRKHLSLLESWHILTHNHLTERIIKHSFKVGLGAFRLYSALAKKYSITEKELLICFCGGLLHDICRLEKHHAEVGAAFIQSLGYKKVASIIKAHTNLPSKIIQELNSYLFGQTFVQNRENLSDKPLNPYKLKKSSLPILCVHLSDKFYAGDEFIGMQKRFEYIRERFAGDENALNAIQKREEIALKTAYWFFAETNRIGEECAQSPTQHEFERIIMEEYQKLY